MTTEELIKALREKPSRDNRKLLDEAADYIETAEKSIRFLAGELASRVAEVEKQEREIERLNKILNLYALQYGTVRDFTGGG